jgi:hypothetical protein
MSHNEVSLMDVKTVLRKLDLGNSVAEFDQSLERYFVETETFRAFVSARADIVAGDKGTGKTAMLKIFQKRLGSLPELAKVEVVAAFNPTGNPVFQVLAQTAPLKEGQYVTIWKAYILSLVGNWLLHIYEGAFTRRMASLDGLLRRLNLRGTYDSPGTIFSRLVSLLGRAFKPKGASVSFTLNESGIPVVTPKLEFGDDPQSTDTPVVPHEDALGLLNAALEDADLTLWVLLDRLDEAFQGFPVVEVPALRALLRTYLDLLAFNRIKLKLFVRKDLFRKVTQGGFVNLTHVNARKVEIVWDEDDLLNLLCRRVREGPDFASALELVGRSDRDVFAKLFPQQVEVGLRKPTTWSWMMARIRDGNDVKPPRNLIDLVTKAQHAQLQSEERTPRDFREGVTLIEADAIRKALHRLSEERVVDTLLAEAAELAPTIERFRDGKAEHNEESLARVLGIREGRVRTAVKPLVEIGFLEEVGGSYKVPMLYRDGLGITQGKAFSGEPEPEDEE